MTNPAELRSIDRRDDESIHVIDQRLLPWREKWVRLDSLDRVVGAIATMVVRGAPLIGVTAAYGMWIGAIEEFSDDSKGYDGDQMISALHTISSRLLATRPTAVNLAWAIERQIERGEGVCRVGGGPDVMIDALRFGADRIAEEDVANCRKIGRHGVELIRRIAESRPEGEPVRIATHCNAGRLACVAWGTATAPIYAAHTEGIPVEVLVDETRPRLQGARLTAWEMARAGIPHHVIVDSAAGLMMQRGLVDMAIVGCDRMAANGDVCNKIGTYHLALAARDNRLPFYVALPESTIDPWTANGPSVTIEERSKGEVREVEGFDGVRAGITAEGAPVLNPAFDITPARLVTAVITERGVRSVTARAVDLSEMPALPSSGDTENPPRD